MKSNHRVGERKYLNYDKWMNEKAKRRHKEDFGNNREEKMANKGEQAQGGMKGDS